MASTAESWLNRQCPEIPQSIAVVSDVEPPSNRGLLYGHKWHNVGNLTVLVSKIFREIPSWQNPLAKEWVSKLSLLRLDVLELGIYFHYVKP